MSSAALAKEVRDRDGELGVLAYDARGHGESPHILARLRIDPCAQLGRDRLILLGKTRTTPPEAEHDLSLSNLKSDLIGIVQHMFPDPKEAPALLVSLPIPATSVCLTSAR